MLENHLKNKLTNKLKLTNFDSKNPKHIETKTPDFVSENSSLESLPIEEEHNENATVANHFNSGYLSPYFINDAETKTASHKDPYIFLYHDEISNFAMILPLLEMIVKVNKPLIIIAEDFDDQVLATLITNQLVEVLNVVAVKAPGNKEHRDEFFHDLAMITNSSVISDDADISFDNITTDILGTAKQVIVSKEKSIFIPIEGSNNMVKQRCEHIQSLMENNSHQDNFEELQQRLLTLTGQDVEAEYATLIHETDKQSLADFFEKIPVNVPDLIMSDTEATILKWLKKVGDQVFKDEIILELETDTIILEVASPEDGYIWAIFNSEGEKVETGNRIALLEKMDYQSF